MKLFFLFFIIFCCPGSLFSQTENRPSMQDWHYPEEVHYLALSDSLRLAYTDTGAGEQTLLFIHGLGSYLRAWEQNIDSLSQHYRCIALDLPGYGKSSKAEHPFDMSFFAGTLSQFMEKLQLTQVILVGHSMGGQIAMHTVLMKQKRIEKLILIAPAGFETFSEKESNWLKSVFNAALIKATPTEQIVRNFEINFVDMPENARFMIDDRLNMRETVEYDRYCEMVPKCVQGMLNEPVFNRLSEIDIPTLIIYGQNDQLIPNSILHPNLSTAAIAQVGHDALPHSYLHLLPDAGHFVQWEQAERVNKAILAFLGK